MRGFAEMKKLGMLLLLLGLCCFTVGCSKDDAGTGTGGATESTPAASDEPAADDPAADPAEDPAS
jgi:hypothetical protein